MIEQTLIILNKLFIIYLSLVCLLFFLFILASTIKFSEYIKAKNSIKDFELEGLYDFIPVSILVPAYNEELTIGDTVDSILASDYKQYEIIVISDGSQDNTVDVLVDKYKMKEVYKPTRKSIQTKDVLKTYKGTYNDRTIILIDKVNGGKGDALNVGINYASYPIFVALDADSIILKNSIKRIVAPFMKNKKTVAIGGNIKISNDLEIKDGVIINKKTSKNFLVIFQTIEYLRAFMTNRMFWDIFNMNLIISGAFGAFNKKVVIDVGGYKNNTIGEDMELVMRIHKYFLEKNKSII